MIDFTQVLLKQVAVHGIGSRSLDEGVRLSKALLSLDDELLRDILVRYFLTPFKSPFFFNFQQADNLVLDSVSELFKSPDTLLEHSARLAEILYDQSEHPRIKPGEFYTVYFEDLVLEGESVQAVGLFKSENKDTFLKVFSKNDSIQLGHDQGISINRLDKGCLIFNTEEEDGYKVCIVDTASAGEEARFWKDLFLKVKPREDKHLHTSSFMKLCGSFCEEMLTEDFNVSRKDQVMIKNRTADYFRNNEKLNVEEFTKEVMEVPEVIEAFNEYKQNFFRKSEIQPFEEFEISPSAVKSTGKTLKSVIKLDRNFHVYVHGSPDYLEKGFDASRNMHYYQLFFNQEL
jgi:hypothetical protein